MSTEVVTGSSAAGTSDFVSLRQRMRALVTMRLGFATVAIGASVVDPSLTSAARRWIVMSSGAYVLLELAAEILRRRGNGRRLWLVAFEVLLDGAYLTWVAFLTGGVLSPLQFLLFVHVIAISLLASYRTGLKIAMWDSLLLLTLAYAGASGGLPAATSVIDSVGGASATAPAAILAIGIVSLWGVTLATASLSAMNERNLRRKRADLEALSRMVAELGESGSAEAIPHVLLERLRETFDIGRGLVLASPEGDLELIGSLRVEVLGQLRPGLDRVVEQAFATRSVQLMRRLDAEHDPRLSAMLPDARNVMVVPLFLAGGFRLGVLVVEALSRGDRIHGWTVAIVQQFATHAALSLHNAWLLAANRQKLEENRRLRDELLANNLTLEARVIQRTQELTEGLERLAEANAERRRLLSHLVRAQEDERLRISGDLHDDPLQTLVAVTMRLDLLGRDEADPVAEDASELREMVRGAIQTLRDLIFELRPPILEDEGLAAALRAHAERWQLDRQLVIHDRFAFEPPSEPRLILYRIAQEAFANVRKHAQATTVTVTLEQQGAAFVVRVVDDGVGFQPGTVDGARQGHIGLTSMRERAELAGGGCQVHSLSGGGTTVEFWVPSTVEVETPDLDALSLWAIDRERATS